MKKTFEILIAAALLGTAATAATAAPRDPAYQSARDKGLVGEKTDGYLGFVTSPSPAIRALVKDLNIRRRAAYTSKAQRNGATIQEMAFRNGCRLIAERTSPGEKYQTPGGAWATRTSVAPTLDPRCP